MHLQIFLGIILSVLTIFITPSGAEETFEQIRNKAIKENIQAQFDLGEMYLEGKGVPQNYTEALKWYQKAADQGYANAQFKLVYMYLEGKGVPQNYTEALKWCRKAADQEYAPAQSILGYMYWEGKDVPQNYARALKWYQKAADQGYAPAQFILGYIYWEGKSVSQNYGEAFKWYQKAADQGYADAQFKLGYMYWEGQGVPQNYGEALKWYQKAADQGHEDAQNNLKAAQIDIKYKPIAIKMNIEIKKIIGEHASCFISRNEPWKFPIACRVNGGSSPHEIRTAQAEADRAAIYFKERRRDLNFIIQAVVAGFPAATFYYTKEFDRIDVDYNW